MEVGGYTQLFEKFALVQPDAEFVKVNKQTNESCSKVTQYYDKLLRPPTDPDLPWTGMVFGLTVSAVWYWCSDQVQYTCHLKHTFVLISRLLIGKGNCAKVTVSNQFVARQRRMRSGCLSQAHSTVSSRSTGNGCPRTISK